MGGIVGLPQEILYHHRGPGVGADIQVLGSGGAVTQHVGDPDGSGCASRVLYADVGVEAGAAGPLGEVEGGPGIACPHHHVTAGHVAGAVEVDGSLGYDAGVHLGIAPGCGSTPDRARRDPAGRVHHSVPVTPLQVGPEVALHVPVPGAQRQRATVSRGRSQVAGDLVPPEVRRHPHPGGVVTGMGTAVLPECPAGGALHVGAHPLGVTRCQAHVSPGAEQVEQPVAAVDAVRLPTGGRDSPILADREVVRQPLVVLQRLVDELHLRPAPPRVTVVGRRERSRHLNGRLVSGHAFHPQVRLVTGPFQRGGTVVKRVPGVDVGKAVVVGVTVHKEIHQPADVGEPLSHI